MENLEKLTDEYLMFMIEKCFSDRTVGTHEWILRHFKTFLAELCPQGGKAVLPVNREAFLGRCKLTKARGVMVGFSRWLEDAGLVEKPNIEFRKAAGYRYKTPRWFLSTFRTSDLVSFSHDMFFTN